MIVILIVALKYLDASDIRIYLFHLVTACCSCQDVGRIDLQDLPEANDLLAFLLARHDSSLYNITN